MTNERKQEIEAVFPNLRGDGEYQETSDETDSYINPQK
jgi:hypothetical protein